MLIINRQRHRPRRVPTPRPPTSYVAYPTSTGRVVARLAIGLGVVALCTIWPSLLALPSLYMLVRPDGTVDPDQLVAEVDEIYVLVETRRFELAIDRIAAVEQQTGHPLEVHVDGQWMSAYDYVEQAMGARVRRAEIIDAACTEVA